MTETTRLKIQLAATLQHMSKERAQRACYHFWPHSSGLSKRECIAQLRRVLLCDEPRWLREGIDFLQKVAP